MGLEGLQLGHYRVLKRIARGGMGEIYLAEDTRLPRQLVIKVIQSESTMYHDANISKEATRLFQREMKAVITLDHPHILSLIDFGEQTIDGELIVYMVIPYRPEGSLIEWMRRRNTTELLPIPDVAHFIGQAADALQHAHDKGIIHQDVKPSNFLIRERRGQPNRPDLLLADFGIAKITTSTRGSTTARGTLTYMAPEQWNGHPTAASDQYSLGIMAYELLTGRIPFQGNEAQVMYQHIYVQPEPPSSVNSRIPARIDAIVLQALEKTSEKRFPSVVEFGHAFQEAIQGAQAPTIERPPEKTPAAPTSGELRPRRIPADNDLRTTLAISEEEAISGTTRTLTLPGGRKVTVQVPPRIPNGSTLRLEGQGESIDGGPRGALVVTIAIKRAEEERSQAPKLEEKTSLSRTDRVSPVPTVPQVSRRTSTSIPPSVSMSQTTFTPPPLTAPPSNERQIAGSRRPFLRVTKRRVALLIAIALLVVISGLGTFYFRSFNYIQRVSLLNQVIPNPYSPNRGILALNDPLKDNSNGYFWPEGTDINNGATCMFTGGAYQVSVAQPRILHECGPDPTFSNFVYQVQITITRGDFGGIAFRIDNTFTKYYYFRISQDGSYELVLNTGSHRQVLQDGSGSSIHTGLGQQNTLAVVANGNTITLYVNNQQVTSVNDSTYSQGRIGVIAGDGGNPTEVEFRDAKVWTL